MTTDELRRLLELAAKAMGYDVMEPFRNGEFRVCDKSDRYCWSFAWRPHTDDGDSARMRSALLIDDLHNASIDGADEITQLRAKLDTMTAERNGLRIALNDARSELAEALRMAVAADTAEDWSRAVDHARKALEKAGMGSRKVSDEAAAALAKANGGGNG